MTEEEAEELSPEQEEELHRALRDLQDKLQHQLDEASDATATVDLEQPIGRVSRIDALQQQKMAKEQRRRQDLRLAQVRQALKVLDDGEYGYCRRCEEPIGYPRLKARPESPFCLACMSSIERRRG